MSKTTEKLLLDSGPPSYLARGMTVLSIVSGTAMCALAFWLIPDMRKLDGTLEPLEARIALGALMTVTGLLMSVGIWLYIQLYALRVVRKDQVVEITTSRVLYNHTDRYNLTDFAEVDEHTGRFVLRQASDPIRKKFELNTPFMTLRPKSAFLPYILDRKITTFDKRAIERLAGKS
ncbi:MAG: hypothetical protein AAGB04_29575 [Pseudomonadota bacterium]